MYEQDLGRFTRPGLPVRIKYESLSSHCFSDTQCINLDLIIDPGKTAPHMDLFDYKLNTTICDDGTICPHNFFSSSNSTCCDNHQGIQEINYSNNAFLPTVSSDLSSKISGLKHTHWAP